MNLILLCYVARLKIYFQNKPLKIFLSGTTRPGVLIFGMYNHLVDFYQVFFSNYFSVAKKGLPRGHMFYIGLCRENMNKSSCLIPLTGF